MSSDFPTTHSYRNAILETSPNIVEASSDNLCFVDYTDLYIPDTKKAEKLTAVKREFMMDIMEPISYLTAQIVDYYSFHNIANILTSCDVLECFERSVEVCSTGDHDFEHGSEEEDV